MSQSWEFVTATPARALGIASMVGYRAVDVPDSVHRGLPSSALTFIVSLDDGVEAADSALALADARPNPVVLSGLHVEASHVRQRRGQAGVQLAVHPLASRRIFGVPSAELSVRGFHGTDVLGRRGAELYERVAGTGGWSEAFDLINGYLRGQAEQRHAGTVRPEVVYAWRLLQHSGGRRPIAAVAGQVGVSPRHLTTLFEREVGRSPKTVAKLMRFERAVALLSSAVRHGGCVDLAATAAEAGYSDQSHLTRDFRQFTGVPPRVWLHEEFRNIQDGGHAVESRWGHEPFESHGLADAAGP